MKIASILDEIFRLLFFNASIGAVVYGSLRLFFDVQGLDLNILGYIIAFFIIGSISTIAFLLVVLFLMFVRSIFGGDE